MILEQNAHVPAEYYRVSNRSLKLLLDSSWLNDEILNNYFGLIVSQFGGETFQSTNFAQGTSAKQRRQRNLDDVIIPLNQKNQHWILLRVLVEKEEIEIYDSMQKSLERYLTCSDINRVKLYMVHYGKAKSCWKLVIRNSEQQRDGTSCGLMTMMNAKCIRMNIPAPRMNDNIMGHRGKFLLEIMTAKILPIE